MAWRRKRKADEKGPPKKGRATKKAQADDNIQAEQRGATVPDQHENEDPPVPYEAGGAFFGCYLLSSINPKRKGATYIGFTVNPARRLRQHNGELTSGAWKTKSMRPVEMVLTVYGFRSMVHALQFEWAWQHPTVSLAVKEAAAGIKKRGGVKGKIALLYAMLNLPKWNKLPLVVQFVSGRHIKHKLGLPPLPGHMDCILAPLSRLRCQVDDAAEDPPIRDEPTAAEAPALVEDSSQVDPPGASGQQNGSDNDSAEGSVREEGSGGPAQQPAESSWADPLSDWDWLDRDRGAELEKEGSQEMPPTDPFVTWQRLKVPARIEKGPAVGDNRAMGGFEPSTSVRAGADTCNETQHAEIGVGRDRWGYSWDTANTPVRLDGRDETCGEEQENDEAGEAGTSSESEAETWARELYQGRESSQPLGKGKATSTVLDRGRKEMIDLVGEEDARTPAHKEDVGRRASLRVEQHEQDFQLRRGAKKPTARHRGVELVVLDDSPQLQKPKERSERGFALGTPHMTLAAQRLSEVRSRTTASVAPVVTQITHARSDGSRLLKSRLMGSATVIDLDP